MCAARGWLNENWLYAGLTGGCFYLAMLPLLRPAHSGAWSTPDLLLYLQLPLYMSHQLEEHYHDRFRLYVNTHLGHGCELLTKDAVTFINVISVWCVDLLALYGARFGCVSWALAAFYLAIVNGIVHLLAALRTRNYNPGLVTALVLLLPAASRGAAVYSRANHLGAGENLGYAGLAVALHAAIIAYVARRRAILIASRV
ncbi:HXXEE domain-containing protein [Granulicella sp. WH15]|uniref:HXXEE domain-containing protein n=1 Tax=Granulicella sp. WH15 TaxID=2602070 RepID=UPI001366D417|nr:HXXEE domain-containing protein [Granulicella sp. WH15]QHN03873.1 HXXEE domain-containing protein [Granulicella sp. WH15]